MTYPTVPPELQMAYAINVADLRPWEYEACEADTFYQVRELRGAFEEAKKDARAALAPPDVEAG